MEKYLPVVKRAIAASMSANIRGAEDLDFLKSELKEIKKVNPVVSEFIRRFSKTTKDRKHAAYCGVMVYKLLYSQMEADLMNEADLPT